MKERSEMRSGIREVVCPQSPLPSSVIPQQLNAMSAPKQSVGPLQREYFTDVHETLTDYYREHCGVVVSTALCTGRLATQKMTLLFDNAQAMRNTALI